VLRLAGELAEVPGRGARVAGLCGGQRQHGQDQQRAARAVTPTEPMDALDFPAGLARSAVAQMGDT
jgi:hypothetical protein